MQIYNSVHSIFEFNYEYQTFRKELYALTKKEEANRMLFIVKMNENPLVCQCRSILFTQFSCSQRKNEKKNNAISTVIIKCKSLLKQLIFEKSKVFNFWIRALSVQRKPWKWRLDLIKHVDRFAFTSDPLQSIRSWNSYYGIAPNAHAAMGGRMKFVRSGCVASRFHGKRKLKRMPHKQIQ